MPDIDFDQKIILPIVEFPEVPTQIIEAYNQKKLVIFIGAGVSRLVGCKGWDQLAQELIEACYLEQKAPGKSLINYSTKIKLGNISDHRKIITICKKLLENEKKNNVFYDVLEKL
ncbi:MAG: hypothetical protein IPJ75_13605 [Ignavibacteriales bacterium]|nr:hypothetical protein [Ignavibacteriales bacterium]